MARKAGSQRADNRYMQRALDLAGRVRGETSPNPMVGAVIVKNGRVIAEGYHRRAGSDHAEVVALKKAGSNAAGAAIYVSLEPCCHTGQTGPCTEQILKAGIKTATLPAITAINLLLHIRSNNFLPINSPGFS